MQFLEKSVKPFKTYRKLNYLTFDLDIWPYGHGHKMLFSQISFIMLCKIGLAIP